MIYTYREFWLELLQCLFGSAQRFNLRTFNIHLHKVDPIQATVSYDVIDGHRSNRHIRAGSIFRDTCCRAGTMNKKFLIR